MANLPQKSDEVPKNTQEGDNVIAEKILRAKKNAFVDSNTAVEARDSGLEKEFEVLKENGSNGRIEDPGATINHGSESVRSASIPSIDEMEAADAMMKLDGKTAEEVMQEGTLDEKMALLRTIFSDIHEQEKEYKKIITNFTRGIEMLRINNSKLKSRVEEAKSTAATLKGERRLLVEKSASLEEALKKEEEKYDVSMIRHRIKWLEKESNVRGQQHRLEMERKLILQNILKAKKAEISFLLIEHESEQTESEELKALKEEEAEMQKTLESCKETIKRIIDDTVRIKREDEKKAEKIESMARNQNEWIMNTSSRINNLRESFVEMQATICEKVNDLTESISNLIDKLEGNHCEPTASIFDDSLRIDRQENPLEAPSADLVFIEDSSSLNSTAEENLEESSASIHEYTTLLQGNGASVNGKLWSRCSPRMISLHHKKKLLYREA